MSNRTIDHRQHSPDMFETRWMNHFSRVRWFVPMLIVFPIIAIEWLLYWNHELSIHWILGWFLGGLFVWTLMEYLFHRYLFHFNNHTNWSERMHFVMHGVHHDHPNDKLRLVMPPIMSLTIIFISFLVCWTVFQDYWFAAHSGFILGYLCYDMIHFAIHHAHWKWNWFQTLKTHHAIHHFKDEHVNYGVSSQLWDYILGTRFKKKA